MNHLEPRVAGCERLLNALRTAMDGILKRLAAVEQALRDLPPSGGGDTSPDGGTGNSIIAKLSTAVSTMAGASPGSGTGTIQGMLGVTLTDTGRSVTLYSIHDKAISAGAYVQATKAAGNKYFIHDVDSCANIQGAGNAAAMDWLGVEAGTAAANAAGAASTGGRTGGDAGGGGEYSEPPYTPGGSTVTRTQHAVAHNSSGTASCAFASNTAAGATLVAAVATGGATISSGPAGWSKRGGNASGPVEIWWKANASSVTAGSSLSWTLSTTDHYCVALAEYAGLGTAPTAGTAATNSGSPVGSLSCGPVALSAAGVVVAAFMSDNGNSGTFTGATGGFALVDQAADGNPCGLAFVDRAAGSGSYTPGVTRDDVQGIYAVAVALHA